MILMNDFAAEPAALREAMVAAATRVFASGWYVLGPEVRAFEGEWSARCDGAHTLGVANGMDAIELSLRALDIGPGDEVITTPMTAFATALAICRAVRPRSSPTSTRKPHCFRPTASGAACRHEPARSC
jgi:dTDP-4-amino-4,6-dideoxygalactose transaminase